MIAILVAVLSIRSFFCSDGYARYRYRGSEYWQISSRNDRLWLSRDNPRYVGVHHGFYHSQNLPPRWADAQLKGVFGFRWMEYQKIYWLLGIPYWFVLLLLVLLIVTTRINPRHLLRRR